MGIQNSDQDTIVAISTSVGEGGIGVVRLSGPEAIAAADRIFQSRRHVPVRDQKSFTAQLGNVVCRTGDGLEERVDECLLLVMRAPKSYTCEDVVEISAHGGQAVLQMILELAIKAGARLAARGEFTKRAFLNGRIDLLQAEAVIDLIQAKTELARRWASAQLEGELTKKITPLKEELINVLSQLEASIDFPDDFLDTPNASETGDRLSAVAGTLGKLLSGSDIGLRVKRGTKVVISGRPNVGKSSLMNRLSRSNRVIVTPYPGTTRDVVEEEIQIRGFPVRLTDTAGIQDTDHPIEKEGVERSKREVETADLVLHVLDASQPYQREEELLLMGLNGKKRIFVFNKTDLPRRLHYRTSSGESGESGEFGESGDAVVETSCVTENGIECLENEIFNFLTGGWSTVSDEVVVSSVRQKELLERAHQYVQEAREACHQALSPEFAAADVRLALDQLGQLVGEVVTDEVLDTLFSQFCIGK